MLKDGKCPNCGCIVVGGNPKFCVNEGYCPMRINTEYDPVDHPPHYNAGTGHEVADCLSSWGLESDALLWNAVKYIARHKRKGDALNDLRKAEWYLLRRIVQLEKEIKP